MGCYLYAVVESTAEARLGPIGLDAAEVYFVGDGRFAAVVSELPNAKIRPERRRLAAHHEVLKQLREKYTVLPMAFGVIAESAEAIRAILKDNREAFEEQAKRVAGKMEMGLRVMWDVPNIFEYFVELSPELRSLRDHMFRNDREPTQDEKIELGRIFDRVISAERMTQTEKVLSALRDICSEIKENKPRNEKDVMSLACLIAKDAQQTFEDAVVAVAQQFDNHYVFDYNGPWPPHNFVEVELKM
jgi:hypothetical protein